MPISVPSPIFLRMQFRSRSDGSHFPVSPRTTMNLDNVRSQKGAWQRAVNKKQLSSLRTLENPLLWSNFLKKYEKLNPAFDFENEVDRTLEVDEALNEIREKHPDFLMSEEPEEFDHKAAFREDLEERGISNAKVQNLIVKQDNPLSEDELAEVAGALNTRSEHAVITDKALRAPITNDVRRWSRSPNRLDVKTVDDRG